MDRKKREAFLNLMKKMSKKGSYDILEYVSEKGSLHYGEIMSFALDNHVVQSRATVTLVVRNLSKLGLLKRTVIDSRPVRTVYEHTENGQKVLKHFQEMEKLSFQ